jgi:hypothetical protein
MIRELFWRVVARIVTIPTITGWLMERARRTPYRHIHGPDGSLYMGRWWLFNPYPTEGTPDPRSWLRRRLPSVRIHHICRPDSDRALHDHPWNARTVILRGGYIEERPAVKCADSVLIGGKWRSVHRRVPGYTGRLLFGQYHRISSVAPEGAWTLFITWKKQGTWGFLVDGKKVNWREYLNEEST